MKIKNAIIACCLISAVSSYTLADITGKLDVRITIGTGCSISNGGSDSSFNQFGTLDFGTHVSLASQVEAQSTGNGGNSVLITCSLTLPYTVTVDSGSHPNTAQRRMQNQSTGFTNQYIDYNLYQNAARTTPWLASTPLAQIGTGLPTPLNFYGRVPAAVPVPESGTYTDSVTVMIDW